MSNAEFDYKKILVAHPERQHSFRVAEALYKKGMLYKYVTTVYDKKASTLMRMLKLFLNRKDLKKANSRRMQAVPDSDVVQFCELEGLFFLLAWRIDKKKRVLWHIQRHVSNRFQKKLARYIIENKVGVVISYDLHSKLLFEILDREAPQVIRIIDDAHPNRNALYDIYKKLEQQSGPFAVTHSGLERWLTDEGLANEYGVESRLADLHIAASTFSRSTIQFNGFSNDRIILAPYGVDGSVFKPKNKCFDGKLKVLFVGSINQRKGIYQILEAAKQLNGHGVEFTLVGSGRAQTPELYRPYEGYVTFKDWVSQDELSDLYGTSHVFVFPSMGEGFGLVLLEAMSAGLPIIASRNCAGPDLIEDGKNGFLIEAGSVDQLVEKIEWFIENKEKLPQMQECAMATARTMTWKAYEANLTEQLTEKIPAVLVAKEEALRK